MTDHFADAGKPMPDALRLADELDGCAYSIPADKRGWTDDGRPQNTCTDAAAELRRLRAENEALRVANKKFGDRQEWWNERMYQLESDPDYDYCHRLAILLECMTLDSRRSFDNACALLDEYYAARDKWAEAQGQPYVSPFGKD